MSAASLDGGAVSKRLSNASNACEEEKKAIADDIKDVYAEAKGNGYDVKIMRKIVSLRRQDENKRRGGRGNSGSLPFGARRRE